MKRSQLTRRPKSAKQPWTHAAAPPKPARKRVPPVSAKRAKDNARLAAHIATLPDYCQCPLSGLWWKRSDCVHHHPAGRRKAAFLFVVPIPPGLHEWIHEHGKRAEAKGLLFPGRNRRNITYLDALEMLKLVPYPRTYAECVKLWGLTLGESYAADDSDSPDTTQSPAPN
jgi:hypothetical protein